MLFRSTGCNGQIGAALRHALGSARPVVACGRAELDLADADAIVAKVRAVQPVLIINAAAYTAVDRAETESAPAMAVNAKAPAILAEEAARIDAMFVHYSTDYVFDGRKTSSYVEDDQPVPLNVYGRSKLEGERAIAASGAAHLIFRTSWVYGARGRNFLLTILQRSAELDEMNIVSDQTGAPTWSRDIARATLDVLKGLNAGTAASDGAGDRLREVSGVYHLSAAGATSWFGFAEAIVALAAPARQRAKLRPIPAASYPAPAQRPANSLLSNAKLHATFGIVLPPWQDSLQQCMAEMPAA